MPWRSDSESLVGRLGASDEPSEQHSRLCLGVVLHTNVVGGVGGVVPAPLLTNRRLSTVGELPSWPTKRTNRAARVTTNGEPATHAGAHPRGNHRGDTQSPNHITQQRLTLLLGCAWCHETCPTPVFADAHG
jgi:hypothetical protein